MKLLFLVSAGGAIGAALRFLTYQAFAGLTVSRGWSLFPWATLTVNVVGSFLMGMAAVTITERFGASPEMRAFFMAGILGGFTTFSAFSLDVFELYAHHSPAVVGGYIGASVALSIGALLAGMFFARWTL